MHTLYHTQEHRLYHNTDINIVHTHRLLTMLPQHTLCTNTHMVGVGLVVYILMVITGPKIWLLPTQAHSHIYLSLLCKPCLRNYSQLVNNKMLPHLGRKVGVAKVCRLGEEEDHGKEKERGTRRERRRGFDGLAWREAYVQIFMDRRKQSR